MRSGSRDSSAWMLILILTVASVAFLTIPRTAVAYVGEHCSANCSCPSGGECFSWIHTSLCGYQYNVCVTWDYNCANDYPAVCTEPQLYSVAVKSKTIFGDQFSGLSVKVEWRELGHRRRTNLATPLSLQLQGLCKFTAKSTTTVSAVRYRFAHWEDDTGILSGSRTLYYDVQSAKTFYAVYGPRQYRLTLEVKNATNARVPGATVEVTQLGQTYTAVTNSRGRAVIGGIYAGQPFNLRIIIDGSLRHEETLAITKNTKYKIFIT